MQDLAQIAAEKWKEWTRAVREYRCTLKPCIIMFAVYVIGITAILRANFNYRDDLMRGYHGKGGGITMAGISPNDKALGSHTISGANEVGRVEIFSLLWIKKVKWNCFLRSLKKRRTGDSR